MTLSNLGSTFWQVGELEEALVVIQEADRIYRDLVEDYPDRYRGELAKALAIMGLTLLTLNRIRESVHCLLEGLELATEGGLLGVTDFINSLLVQAYAQD
jgi:tetratricopeptide (TPR) repeat protein